LSFLILSYTCARDGRAQARARGETTDTRGSASWANHLICALWPPDGFRPTGPTDTDPFPLVHDLVCDAACACARTPSLPSHVSQPTRDPVGSLIRIPAAPSGMAVHTRRGDRSESRRGRRMRPKHCGTPQAGTNGGDRRRESCMLRRSQPNASASNFERRLPRLVPSRGGLGPLTGGAWSPHGGAWSPHGGAWSPQGLLPLERGRGAQRPKRRLLSVEAKS